MKALVATVAFLTLLSGVAYGQDSGAQAFFLDPSVRAAGMGRSSCAVFWGDDPNHWANPALLGYHHGFRFERGRTQLVPDLADDVYFTTKRLTLGGFGVGLSLAGKPLDSVGNLFLDYGESIYTDAGSSEPLGRFRSFEDVASFGIGVNVAEVSDQVLKLVRGTSPDLRRFGDVSLGWSVKTDSVFLSPALAGQPEGSGEVTTHDRGFVLRITPYNSIDFTGFLPDFDAALHPLLSGIRWDVSYGEGTQNTDDATIALVDENSPDPVVKASRRGWATRVSLGLPGAVRDGLEENGAGWLARMLTPLVSWGRSWDRTGFSPEYDPFPDSVAAGGGDHEIEDSGWELTIANVYTIRRGRVDDPDGSIHGKTTGWGLGLRLGDLAGFRIDRATIPQYVELDRVHRRSFTFFVDGLALWRVFHDPGRELVSAHY